MNELEGSNQRTATSRRLAYLRRYGDYLMEGPSTIEPPRPLGERIWMVSSLTIERGIPFKDPTELFSIYQLPNYWKAAIDNAIPPVVRRVIWNRASDRQTAKKHLVGEPTLVSTFFEVPLEELAELSRLTLQLDRALPSFPFEFEGISLVVPEKLAANGDTGLANNAGKGEVEASHELRVSRGTRFTSLSLSCASGVSNEFDEAFFSLWGFLDTACTEDRRARDWEEQWLIAPYDYATVLRDQLGLED